MKKVTIIGAGSAMFTRRILSSLYCHPELASLQVVLEDVDASALRQSLALAHKMLEQEGLGKDAELRKVVEEDWHISAVMVLPEGVFQETANTTTRADILILKKKGQGIFNSETN